MAVEAPTVAEFDLQYLSTQGPYLQNTLYFSKDAGWSLSDRVTMAESLEAAWTLNVAPLVAPTVSLQQITHRDLSTDPYGPPSVYTVSPPVPGGNVGQQAAPYQVCAIVQFLSPAGGPPFRSYIRHGGLTEDQTTGNRLDGTAEADLELAWAAVSDEDGGLVGVQHVILSRQAEGVPLATALIAPVSDVEVRNVLGRAVSRAGVGL